MRRSVLQSVAHSGVRPKLPILRANHTREIRIRSIPAALAWYCLRSVLKVGQYLEAMKLTRLRQSDDRTKGSGSERDRSVSASRARYTSTHASRYQDKIVNWP